MQPLFWLLSVILDKINILSDHSPKSAYFVVFIISKYKIILLQKLKSHYDTIFDSKVTDSRGLLEPNT